MDLNKNLRVKYPLILEMLRSTDLQRYKTCNICSSLVVTGARSCSQWSSHFAIDYSRSRYRPTITTSCWKHQFLYEKLWDQPAPNACYKSNVTWLLGGREDVNHNYSHVTCFLNLLMLAMHLAWVKGAVTWLIFPWVYTINCIILQREFFWKKKLNNNNYRWPQFSHTDFEPCQSSGD